MLFVKYIGPKKAGIYIALPIGCKSKAKITDYILVTDKVPLQDDQAKLLVELDPINFQIASEMESERTAAKIRSKRKNHRKADNKNRDVIHG